MHEWIASAGVFAVLLMASSGPASCWEISYEGDVLPNSAELGEVKWSGGQDTSLTYTHEGVLRTVDPWVTRSVEFNREHSMPAGSAVTIESRLRVLSVSSAPADWFGGRPGLGIQVPGRQAVLGLLPGKVFSRYSGDTLNREYAVDLTQWHTFRIALAPDGWFKVWMDDGPIFSGSAYAYGQSTVFFGTSTSNWEGTDDIEWDYVRYSKEYLPIPESSSLLALFTGIGAYAGFVRRRRR
jgi:hypothetical protein